MEDQMVEFLCETCEVRFELAGWLVPGDDYEVELFDGSDVLDIECPNYDVLTNPYHDLSVVTK